MTVHLNKKIEEKFKRKLSSIHAEGGKKLSASRAISNAVERGLVNPDLFLPLPEAKEVINSAKKDKLFSEE